MAPEVADKRTSFTVVPEAALMAFTKDNLSVGRATVFLRRPSMDRRLLSGLENNMSESNGELAREQTLPDLF